MKKYACTAGMAALSLGLILVLASCGGNQSPAGGMQMPKATVTATTISSQVYQVTESFPGTLTANNIVQLRADVTGYLEAIRVPDGSAVHKGQVLYEIDRSRYQAAYNQAKASLQQAQADLEQRQRDLERYQNLLQHDAIAKQTVDQAGTAVKTSQANVAAAQAAMEKASTDLDHALMRAPVSGKIGIVQIKIGDIVNAGQTLINTIVNDDPMYVDFDVPQNRAGEFSVHTTQQTASRKYYVQLAGGSLYSETGKVEAVDNAIDPTTGTLRVRLSFPNPKGELKSGMNAVVLVKHPSDSNEIAVPTKALIQTLAETSVYTVGAGNVIEARSVQVGPQMDSLTLIEKGLSPGDKVVVDGLQKARPGDTVQVNMAQ